MGEKLSMVSELEGRAALRQLDRENESLPEGAREIDVRSDAANVVGLYLLSKEVMLVKVTPNGDEGLPFELQVPREQGLDAYRHPYAYIDRTAA
jgi:hypothetical protein